MMVRHECGLEHDMPQQMSSATDTFFHAVHRCHGQVSRASATGKCHGQFSCASVTGNRRKTCQSRCLFGGYLAKPGYFCDQHRAGDRPNPGHGP